MKSSDSVKSAIESRVSIDWIEFTLFDRFQRVNPDLVLLVQELISRGKLDEAGAVDVGERWPWTVEQACELLGDLGEEPVKQDRGALGYKCRHICKSGAVILSDGNEDMGMHISLSGAVCQAADSLLPLLRSALDEGANMTRIDLAIDDTDEVLNLPLMIDKCRAGECSSRLKSFLIMEGGKIADGTLTGLTLYLGKKDSDFMARIYDKRLESIYEKGIDPATLPAHWVRAEMQCGGIAAQNAALELVGGFKLVGGEKVEVEARPLNKLAAGVLANYVNFKDRNGDTNKSRWPLSPFWKRFIAGAVKVKIGKQILPGDIDRRAKWFAKQCASSVAMLLETHGNEKLTNMVVHAGKNLSKKQRDEMAAHERKKERLRKQTAPETKPGNA